MNAKQLKKIHIWIRAITQLLYFIFIPSVYTAAFAGVKYIFTQIGAGEKVALTSFVTVLIVLSAIRSGICTGFFFIFLQISLYNAFTPSPRLPNAQANPQKNLPKTAVYTHTTITILNKKF